MSVDAYRRGWAAGLLAGQRICEASAKYLLEHCGPEGWSSYEVARILRECGEEIAELRGEEPGA